MFFGGVLLVFFARRRRSGGGSSGGRRAVPLEAQQRYSDSIAKVFRVCFHAQFFRKSQKTRQSTVQEMNGVQSWISPPPLMAPRHCKTSILGAVIVSERGISWTPLIFWTSSCGSFIFCPIIARYMLQNQVSRRRACVKLSAKGGIAPIWGSANLP